jgi:hypothetical protein
VEFRNSSKTELVERVKSILATRNLTLYQVSHITRSRYGRASPYFLPHNLYYDLAGGTFSPGLHQLFAISRISNYRLNDWLRVFGFDLEDIPRLQVMLPSKRTVLLDWSLDDPDSWVPWFRDRPETRPAPEIAPLGQLLDLAPPVRLQAIAGAGGTSFVYAKIGREDAFAFPELLPGSIVRADTRRVKALLPTGNGRPSDCLFLIEHAHGLCCCRLQAAGKNRVMPVSLQLPYAQVELQLHEEVRILGVADLEIRSLLRPEQPQVPKDLAEHWKPVPLAPAETRLSQLLRRARSTLDLSLREASALSRRIAAELREQQYFTAPGSLSDYEAGDTPPRHVHKTITLCAAYGLQFSTFLKSLGLDREETGQEPISDNLAPRHFPAGFHGGADATVKPTENGFLEQLMGRWQDVPFFLRGALSSLSGLATPSLHDFFWVGGKGRALHPLLANGLLAIVNRRKKRPIHSRSRARWQQPLSVLLRRDGTYLCGCCSLEGGALVIHPYSQEYQPSEQFRNHHEAEVVGQVVTIARNL